MNWRLRGPGILGALLDAAARGLHELPRVRSERLPRMANFAFWAMACETAFWPADSFLRAYDANRRAAIESVIDKDPVGRLRARDHGRPHGVDGNGHIPSTCRSGPYRGWRLAEGRRLAKTSPRARWAAASGAVALRWPSAVNAGRAVGRSR
jgi:hypothetical protein